ncbi:MAG: ferrous iron transport protein A [Thermodesulfobacteriota bacterium]|nr:MAG: ferrous iron transport protein A [Thermodesulfobacteriota bacterium]
MLLIDTRCGDKIEIKGFLGKDAILKKIETMGLRKGDIFEVIQRWGKNFLLKNGNNRLIISSDIAKNIEVELISTTLPFWRYRSWIRRRWRWGWFK